MNHKTVVLITGASSGIGKAIAGLLVDRGYEVYGTSRDPSHDSGTTGATQLPLDVRSEESVRSCVRTVVEKSGRLDVLVNNAGYALIGALEEASMKEAKEQFDTNFFGMARMVKETLPVMRREGGGRIINIGSLAGVMAVPFMGFYSAGKHALEGYTEALAYEARPFNIRVSLLEPGFIRTGLGRNSRVPEAAIGDYDPWRVRALESINGYIDKGPGPDIVARCVLRAIESNNPKARYKVGQEAARVILMRWLIPYSLFEKAIRGHFRINIGRT